MEKSLCYNCFKEYEGGGACPACGYDHAGQAGNNPLALRPGTILGGRYIVGRVLGQGGFGITYLAQDYDSKAIVAIKEHFPAAMVTRDEESGTVQIISESAAEAFSQGMQNFLEEAKTLSRFNGTDCICDVYSYFEENGTAYFAMEYVQGRLLGQWLESRGGKLDFAGAVQLLMPAMKALGKVHAEGIIHRDIAPDNIIVGPGGEVTLIDFGAARYAMGDVSQSLDVILRHGYAPGEQYARRGRQGPYTDVYAMAATLYTVICGRKLPDAIERAQKDSLLRPSALGVQISPAAEAVLMKALETDYNRRYRDMNEFCRALEEALQAKPLSAGGKKAAIIIAIIAAAAAAALIFLMGGDKTQARPEAPAPIVTQAPRQTPEPSPELTQAPEALPSADIDWTLSEDGTLTLRGEGRMADYLPGEAPWLAQGEKKIKKLVAEEGISYLGSNAFYGCGRLENVSLPESLGEIGEGCFEGCSTLAAVTLPQGLEVIGSRAFSNCWELYGLELPAGLRVLGDSAFANCNGLSEILIPGGVLRVGEEAFANCTMVSKLVIEEGVECIGSKAFLNCRRISNVSLPASLMRIESEAFNRCSDIVYVSSYASRAQWERVEIAPEGNSTLLEAQFGFAG